MIRLEGIPIVAARLEAAQKAKTMQSRKRARRVNLAVARPAIGSAYGTMKKSA